MSTLKKKVAATLLSASLSGLAMISAFESGGKVITQSYLDPVGIWTICNGHIKGVTKGMKVTPTQCQKWLVEDASWEGRAIGRLVKVPLTQNQYDALLSLIFNVGSGNFASSTLLKKLNQGLCLEAANQFLAWDKARVGGVLTRLKGLTKRRAVERELFVKDCD